MILQSRRCPTPAICDFSALTRPTAHLISAMPLGTPVSRVLRPCKYQYFSNTNAPLPSTKLRQMRVIMAKTKFRPLHDRVVVKRVDAEDKSKGGIIIPDTAKDRKRAKLSPSAPAAATRTAS